MYIRGESARISFFYPDDDGLPVSGAVLVALIRKDQGAWTSSNGSPSEPSPGVAPGFYDLVLTEQEADCDHLDWMVRTSAGVFVTAGQIDLVASAETTADAIFAIVFGEPSDSDDAQLQCAFMDRLADHVLRRAMSSAERSSHGDAVSASSLLGVMSLLTQGQLVVTNCSGDSYIFLNSSVQGNPPLGTLRVVSNSAGTPIGVLPLSGPNAVPDATLNCDCPS